MDTTLRDGEQTQGISFSPAEKVNIAKALLEQLKVNRIEVASACVSGGEKEAVTNICEWAAKAGLLEKVEVLGFVDHTRSIDWIVETGGKVINLLAKGSENHCVNQLGTDLAGHLKEIHRTIDYAHKSGLAVNIYLEDWSGGYREKPEYVFEMMGNLQECRINRFMLPDTLGLLTPDEVYSSLSDMITRFPECDFDFHPHNDYGLATANAMMAVKAGVRAIHCTVNCLGERAGNVSLPEVVANLKDHMGIELSVDESHIFRISQMVEYFSGKRIADNTPVVGADVFTQTSGIHADGDRKGRLYESRLGPERFSRTRSYALGKMSGKASLLKNLERLDISLSKENQQKVLKRITELGDSKKVITTEDLPFIIADVLESKNYDHIRLLDCSITSGLKTESTASIQVDVEGEISLSSGIGNGGYHAFVNAMKNVLKTQDIDIPKLLDFEVRIPKGGRSEALTECIITWEDEPDSFKTRGVHSNQVFAAVNATLRMLNIRFHQQIQREQKSRKRQKL
jgi:D-citramalate synthase